MTCAFLLSCVLWYGWITIPLLSNQARDVYEEAILTVVTVRDFTQVFDSYAQFEESMIAAKMETTSEMGKDEDGMRRLLQMSSSSRN